MKTVFVILALIALNFVSNEILNFLFVAPGGMRYTASNAMLPEFKPGVRLYTEMVSPYLKTPFKRGEVVMFYPEFLDAKNKNNFQKLTMAIERIKGTSHETTYFRRVAALPGDLIELNCSHAKIVFPQNVIPAKAQSPQGGKVIKICCQAPGQTTPETVCAATYLVPPGYVFIIGDSTDYMGFVEEQKVFGRVQFIISDGLQIIEPEGNDVFIIKPLDPKFYKSDGKE